MSTKKSKGKLSKGVQNARARMSMDTTALAKVYNKNELDRQLKIQARDNNSKRNK